jgi:hypothetical protein
MIDNASARPPAKNIRAGLIIAGVQIVAASALVLAQKQGIINDDVTTRSLMVVIGLALAVIGNRMPKTTDGPPPASLPVAVSRQAVLRVGGWATMLGGLAFAGVWAFAPRDLTLPGSLASVGVMTAVTIGYCAWRPSRHQRSSDS